MDKFRQQPQAYKMKKQSPKANKQPMKIVYIGNPMMFKANNCWEFRQIVQELTGQVTEKKSTNDTGCMNKSPQDTATINVMDRMVNEDLLRPSSSIRSVFRSSSTENVYEESTVSSSSASELWYRSSSTEHPSSPVEYVHQEKLHPSSSTQFVDDLFSVEMLEKLDEFQYPFQIHDL